MSEEGQNEGSMYWRARADEWKAKAEASGEALNMSGHEVGKLRIRLAAEEIRADGWKDRVSELEAKVEADRRFLSGEQVGVSTGICGDITYGYGTLSDNGYWEYPVNPALVDLKRKAEANAQAAHALEAMRDRRLRVSPPGLHDQWSARTENDSVNVGFGADPIEAVAAYERAKGGE